MFVNLNFYTGGAITFQLDETASLPSLSYLVTDPRFLVWGTNHLGARLLTLYLANLFELTNKIEKNFVRIGCGRPALSLLKTSHFSDAINDISVFFSIFPPINCSSLRGIIFYSFESKHRKQNEE